MADEEDIDSVEEKAAEIGKELGVDDKEPVPDYEIEEEPEERLAKEKPTREKPQLTNKEKRELRKKRINEKFSEKDAIIRQQQEQINQLAAWKEQVDGRLHGINKSEIDQAYNNTLALFKQAEADHSAAFTEGDGAKATRSMQIMYDAKRKLEQIQALKANAERAPQQSMPDQTVVNKAKAWAAKNAWYNPNGGDEGSEVAKGISAALANEGYDPRSDEFWDELDDRVRQRLPDKVKDEDYDDEEEDEAPVRQVRKRPPVHGTAGRGDIRGKTSIALPTAFIKTLKDNGLWENVDKRNKIIKRYLEGAKQNA